MESGSADASNKSAHNLLEEWGNIFEGVKESLAKASEIAARMEHACMYSSDYSAMHQTADDSCQKESEAEGEFELRRPRASSGESSVSGQDPSDSFKIAERTPRGGSPLGSGPALLSFEQSRETACTEIETSMDLLRRRKTVHEIPQIVINTPEGAERFKRRRSTGEVPRTPRMQLSCVNSPGTPSAQTPRTPIPLAKRDALTTDTHFHSPLVGGANSCRKRDISTTDNCPDTPPPKSNATPFFTHDDISSLFEKIKLEAPSKLTPSDNSKRWESDMNAAFYSAFKLIASGMEQVQRENRSELFTPVASAYGGRDKSKSVVTSVLEDVMGPLESLMNTDYEDGSEYAEQTLASIEKAVHAINKQVPLEHGSVSCVETSDFFNRRVGHRVQTMTSFMQKASNKVTDEMRRAHFLDSAVDFGGVATHVSQLLRTYNEAICQLDYLSSGSNVHKVSYDT